LVPEFEEAEMKPKFIILLMLVLSAIVGSYAVRAEAGEHPGCSGAPKCALSVQIRLVKINSVLRGARVIITNTGPKATARILVQYTAGQGGDNMPLSKTRITFEQGRRLGKFPDKLHAKDQLSYYYQGLRPGQKIVFKAIYQSGAVNEGWVFWSHGFILSWRQDSSCFNFVKEP
jgi:hypothetical protein